MDNIFKRFNEEVSIADHTTFKIGGKAKYFFIARNRSDIHDAVKWAMKEGEKFFILGAGSNILFSDKGFNGLVIKNCVQENGAIIVKKISEDKFLLEADASCKLQNLIMSSKDNGLSGLEWAAGIPGTVGGAVRGNAGAFGSTINDSIKKVKVLEVYSPPACPAFMADEWPACAPSANPLAACDRIGGGQGRVSPRVRIFSKERCLFGYRDSIFKGNRTYIILSAFFELARGDKKEISERVKRYLRSRRDKHPSDYPNAGSIFKNVICANKPQSSDGTMSDGVQREFDPSDEHMARSESTRNEFKNIPKIFLERGIIPAGWFIDQCGLKGKRIGNAMVSEKHANFILNLGGAKAKDAVSLIGHIVKQVKKRFGIVLENEIDIVDL